MWNLYLWICGLIALWAFGSGIVQDVRQVFHTPDLDFDEDDETYYNTTDPFFWMFGFLVSFPVVNLIILGLIILSVVFRKETV